MTRKQCNRRVRIATVNPLVFKLEQSAADKGRVLQWRVELAAIVNSLKAGQFSHEDADALHDFISTCFVIANMARRTDVYAYVEEAAECFLAMLKRRGSTGKWGATGDEIRVLAGHVDTMAEAIGALPETTIKIAMARAKLEQAVVRAQMKREKQK